MPFRRSVRRDHLALESLETRYLLSTITVTSLADNTTTDGEITLREAIQAANTDTSVDGSVAGNGADRIEFAAGLAGGTVTLSEGTLEVTESLVFKGPTERITIDADGGGRALEITSGVDQAVLTRMRFVNATDTAVHSEAVVLKLIRSQFENNQGDDGGALYVDSRAASPSLIVKGAKFVDNRATRGSAVFLYAGAVIENARFYSNVATDSGGAIRANGDVSITGAIFKNNQAGSRGGAIEFISSDDDLEMRDSVLTGNTADQGSAFYGSNSAYGSSLIEDSTFENNTARDKNGGTVSVYGFYCGYDFNMTHSTIQDSTISNNKGRGVSSLGCYSDMTISGATIVGNTSHGISAEDHISVRASDVSDNGSYGIVGYALDISSSKISGNQSVGAGAYYLTMARSLITGNQGGGIDAYREYNSETAITNSTIAGNSGFGIRTEYEISVNHVTVTGNRPDNGQAAIQGEVSLRNSIVADNLTPDGTQRDISDDVFVSHSLIGSNKGTDLEEARPGSPDARGNFVGTESDPIDPMLGAIHDNGGATHTAASSHNSPGIDAATGTEAEDQIGRPRGSSPDMGAFEFDANLHLPPSLIVIESSAAEGDEVLDFAIRSTSLPAPGSTITATFDVQSITAREGLDYPEFTPVDISLTASGSTRQTVSVPLSADDSLGEPDRTLQLFASAITGDNGGATPAIGQILNDDDFKVRAVATPVVEGNSGTTQLLIALEILEGELEAFTTTVTTEDGSAKASAGDYEPLDTTVAFSGTEGEQKSVQVTVNGDTEVERDEYFDLVMSWPFDAKAVSAAIVNDDSGTMLQGNTLLVAGSAGDDEIDVNRGNSQTAVTINGQQTNFDSSAFTEIRVESGPGDDTVTVSAEVKSTIEGGAGHDSLTSTGDAGDVIQGGAGRDTISGGAGDDTLIGGDGSDVISGEDGNDRILGQAGADSVLGNSGQDTLWGHSGSDTLVGGSGNDSVLGGGQDDSVVGGTGTDTIAGGGGNDIVHGGTGIDAIKGGSGNDTLSGGADNDTILGEAGEDSIEGGLGNDSLDGGTGEDTLLGQEGSDSIRGEASGVVRYNLADGGEGNDIIRTSTFALGGSGNDTIEGTEGADSLSGGEGDDYIYSLDGNDTLIGDAGDDRLHGNDGNDVIFGGNGADDIMGGNGADRLYGNNGRDYIEGDAGGDTVNGGKSHDFVAGGSDADTITGGSGDDLLAGGASRFVENSRVLEAWREDEGYAERVAAVRALFASGSFQLERDEQSADNMEVEAGRDFYLAKTGLDIFELADNEELFELLP